MTSRQKFYLYRICDKTRIFITGVNNKIVPCVINNLVKVGLNNFVVSGVNNSLTIHESQVDKKASVSLQEIEKVVRDDHSFELLLDLATDCEEKAPIVKAFLEQNIPILSCGSLRDHYNEANNESTFSITSSEHCQNDELAVATIQKLYSTNPHINLQNILFIQSDTKGTMSNLPDEDGKRIFASVRLSDLLSGLIVRYFEHCAAAEQQQKGSRISPSSAFTVTIQKLLNHNEIPAFTNMCGETVQNQCETDDNEECGGCGCGNDNDDDSSDSVNKQEQLEQECNQIHQAFQAFYKETIISIVPLPIPLIDAHCHLQLKSLGNRAAHAIILATEHYHVMQMIACGVTPIGKDWERIEELINQFSDASHQLIVPNFGLHPWYVHDILLADTDTDIDIDIGTSWITRLEGLLERYPFAGVGECGIDKLVLKKHPQVSLAQQVEVFEQQIVLACRYHRNLIIHGVNGSWGTILQSLQKILVLSKAKQQVEPQADFCPKKIVLHSCQSMSIEMITTFQTIFPHLIYYSVSVQAMNSPKMQSLVKAIPIDRLLLESDSPDQLPKTAAITALSYNEPSIMLYTYIQIAQIREMELQTFAKQIYENAQRVFP